jgi:hypothetical protein
MTLYVVRYEHSEYGHGVSGVFASLDAAKAHIIEGWQPGLTPYLDDYAPEEYFAYADDNGNVEVIHIVRDALGDVPPGALLDPDEEEES